MQENPFQEERQGRNVDNLMKVGMGYDVHRLVEDRPLILGGVEIPYEKGLLGHSDADVLLHAIMDALLGAAALGDIGKHFPDTDAAYKGASSIKLLEHVGKLLEEKGIDARIINIHTIKPLDEELIVAAAKETGKVVTVEEHSVIGGLGSAVCDVLSEQLPTPVLKIGVNDVFGHSGPAVELIKEFGLDGDSIAAKVKEFVK